MASVLKVDSIKSLAGNEAITISESGVPLLNVPAFKYILGATVSNVGSTSLVVPIDTKIFNTNDSWYNTSTYRYTPEIPGYYWFKGFNVLQLTTSVTNQQVQLRKNGTMFSRVLFRDTASSAYYIECSGMTYLNGTTDYAECWSQGGATTVNFYADGTEEASGSFEGFLVRAA